MAVVERSAPLSVEELGRRVRDFAYYQRHLKIDDFVTGGLVPWVLNPMQWAIRAEICRQEREGLPVRIIGLKSRRAGFSTTIQGTFTHRANTRRQFSTITIAHEKDAAAYLHRMSEQMYENLPKKLKCPQKRGHAGKMLELLNGSYARVDTANDPNAGRSQGARGIHASEYAHWPHQKDTMRSIRSTVAMMPGTIVVVESTANGTGDMFHGMYLQARERRSDYVALFFPWYYDPLNESEPRAGDQSQLEFYDTELEQAIRESFPQITARQLAWRRKKIANDFDGDVEDFQQEYPSNDDEAFLSGSRSYFGRLDRLVAQPAITQGHLLGQPKGRLSFEVTANQPTVTIFRLPEKGMAYLASHDPAGGISEARLEQFSERSEAEDFNVTLILDRHGRVCARLRVRADIDAAGEEAFKLCRLYAQASGRFFPFAVDVTGGAGWTVVLQFRQLGWPNIWRDRDRRNYTQDRKSQYGYVFTELGRELALSKIKQVARETPSAITDEQLIHEMRGFIWNKRGKPEAGPNIHDDCVTSYAVALVVLPEIQGAAASGATLRPDPALEQTISQLATRGRTR